MEEARTNLTEAVQLFLENAEPSEIAERLREGTYVSSFEVPLGQA